MTVPPDLELQLIDALHTRASNAMTRTDTTHELERWNGSRKLRFPSPRIAGGLTVAAAAAIVAVVLVATSGSKSHPPAITHPRPIVGHMKHLPHLQTPQQVKVLNGPGLAESVAFNAIWSSNQVAGQIERVSLDGTRLLSSFTLPSRYVSPIDPGTPGYNPAYYGPQQAGDVMLVSVHGASSHDGYLVLSNTGRITGFHQVARAGAIAPGPSAAWVQTSPTTLTLTDSSGRLTSVVAHVPGASDTRSVISASQAGGYLWVALDGPTPGKVVQLNASTGAPVGTVTFGEAPFIVVATPAAAYVAGRDYGLYRVDAHTRDVTASLVDQVPNGGFLAPAIGTDGSVWILPGLSAVIRLDPVTLQPVSAFHLEHGVPGDFGAIITSTRMIINDEANKRLESFNR